MADIPLVQLPYPEEETRTFELSTSLSPNWDKNGRIFYTDETGQVVRPQTKYNPLQMLGRRLKAFGSNAKNFVEDFNMDKSHTYFAPFEDINEQYKAGNIDKSELPYLAQGRAEQEIRDAQQQERDNINRGWLGTGLSAASMHPIFNIPYVGTGLGGAMYDLGQGITEGDTADELWDRTKRGFAIGESVGAIPYVGKLAGKTKAGQVVGSAFNNAGEKFANTKLYDALMTDIKGFNPNKQIAYHGSPYDFNKFSNEAIGTGEGAQAHGYGHYAALDKDTAEAYAKNLSEGNKVIEYNGKIYKSNAEFKPNEYNYKMLSDVKTDGLEAAKNFYKDQEQWAREKLAKSNDKKWWEDTVKAAEGTNRLLDTVNPNLISDIRPDTGQLYKLSIPKDDVMWREGLEPHNQPKKVQEIYDKVYKQDAAKIDEKYNTQIDNWKNAQINAWNKLSDYKLGDKSKYAKNLLQAELSEDKNLIDKAWNDYQKNIGFNNNFDPNEVYHYKRDIQDHIFDLNTKKEQEKFWELGRGGYTDFNDPQNVKKWSNAGIKGISYNGGIDGEARVIFNPDDIDIVRKYYNQPNLYEQLTGKQNTGALVDALFNR